MRSALFIFILSWLSNALSAQYVYTIKADSVKLTNCDSSELIIENHTQDVPGFLFNTGSGRTVFRRGIMKINDSLFLIGDDTLKYDAWVRDGNRFGATGVLGTLDNNHLDLYTNNTARARITNNGNLLVGTTADSGSRFQVSGNSYFDGNSTITGSINLGATSPVLLANASGLLSIYNKTLSNSDGFLNAGSGTFSGSDFLPMIMTKTHAGTSWGELHNVFVGSDADAAYYSAGLAVTVKTNSGGTVSTIPLLKLSNNNATKFVVGPTGNAILSDSLILNRVTNGNSSDSILVWNSTAHSVRKVSQASVTATYAWLQGGNSFGATSILGTLDNNHLDLYTADTERVRLTNRGDLLLGSATDNGNKLQVNGNSYFNGNVTITGTTTFQSTTLLAGTLNFVRNGIIDIDEASARLNFPGDGTVGISTGGTVSVRRLSIDTSGRVGIGTTVPNAQLHTTGTVRFAGLTSDTTKTRVVVSDVNGNLYYRDASTLAINSILNSSLAVNGTISAQRLKLSQAGWPDYVFDSSYRLPSLKELEEYIQKNKHLPGMPSAAEVESKGIDVGDHQAALLKKIEELTLYNIAQEEELKAQNKKLDIQTEELSALKKEMVELRKLIEDKTGK